VVGPTTTEPTGLPTAVPSFAPAASQTAPATKLTSNTRTGDWIYATISLDSDECAFYAAEFQSLHRSQWCTKSVAKQDTDAKSFFSSKPSAVCSSKRGTVNEANRGREIGDTAFALIFLLAVMFDSESCD